MPTSILQRLYESEINASVSWLWDGGFDVKLGDAHNGFVAETNVQTWEEVERWLRNAAVIHYPNSHFTKEL